MAIRKIVTYPDKRLREKSEALGDESEILSLYVDLMESMAAHRGVGLSAVQIGVLKTAFIVDARVFGQQGRTPILFCNPRITFYSEDKETSEEGCLSFPGYFANIARSNRIIISYDTFEPGQQGFPAVQDRELEGFAARAVQHEYDHLNGKLYLDLMEAKEKDKTQKLFIALKNSGKLK